MHSCKILGILMDVDISPLLGTMIFAQRVGVTVFIKILSPSSFYSNFELFLYLFFNELLTNVPNNHVYPSNL